MLPLKKLHKHNNSLIVVVKMLTGPTPAHGAKALLTEAVQDGLLKLRPAGCSPFLKPVFSGFRGLRAHEADYLVKTGQMVNKKLDFRREIIMLCGSVNTRMKGIDPMPGVNSVTFVLIGYEGSCLNAAGSSSPILELLSLVQIRRSAMTANPSSQYKEMK